MFMSDPDGFGLFWTNDTAIRPTTHLEVPFIPPEHTVERPSIGEHEAPPIARDLHLSFDNDRVLLEDMLKRSRTDGHTTVWR